MPRASKQQLDKIVWQELNHNLFNLFGSLKEKDVEKFFPQLLTREEQTMLAKRVALYSLIINDFSNSEVKQLLKISHETIRSAHLTLATKDKEFQNRLRKLIKKDSPQFVKFIDLALRSKTSIKARNQLLSGS